MRKRCPRADLFLERCGRGRGVGVGFGRGAREPENAVPDVFRDLLNYYLGVELVKDRGGWCKKDGAM